jgi:hypothetical protein
MLELAKKQPWRAECRPGVNSGRLLRRLPGSQLARAQSVAGQHAFVQAAQRFGQIPAHIGLVGVEKITLVADRLARWQRLIDISQAVAAVWGQWDAGREAVRGRNGTGRGWQRRRRITSGRPFAAGGDLSFTAPLA